MDGVTDGCTEVIPLGPFWMSQWSKNMLLCEFSLILTDFNELNTTKSRFSDIPLKSAYNKEISTNIGINSR